MYINISSDISDKESLSHFIFNKSQLKATAPFIKTGAFRIDKKRPSGEMSVYRCSLVDELDCIWEIGYNFVTQKMQHKQIALGRAVFTASQARSLGCKVYSSTDPHPLHSDVISSHINQAKQLLIAQRLANSYAKWHQNPKYQEQVTRLQSNPISQTG